MLLATAGWVLWQAFVRLLLQPDPPEITLWSFVIILVSMVINVIRIHLLQRAVTESNSPTLQVNIANFTNDILNSLIVLFSLGIIILGAGCPCRCG